MFEIKNLYVCIVEDEIEILCGINLIVNVGEVYVIMGLNGFGKLMLFYIFVGKDDYEVIEGEIFFNGENMLDMELDEWVVVGMFLVFQYLIEILGVVIMEFLKMVMNVQCKVCGEDVLFILDFMKCVKEVVFYLNVFMDMLKCLFNVGFFGGEKKCVEIL